jgi:hypothetical protein
MRRLGVILLFLLCYTFAFAQTDVGLTMGISPWNITHKNLSVSKPISLSYSGGLTLEQILFESQIGFLTGIEYSYCPKGVSYLDLTDQQDIWAGVVASKLNERYIDVAHHELAVPIMMVFYYNAIRSGLGVEFNKYYFPDARQNNKLVGYNDWGLRCFTGTRFSKFVALKIGYYYGLNKVFQFNYTPGSGKATYFTGTMQQLEVSLTFSLFNNMGKDSGYMIQPMEN